VLPSVRTTILDHEPRLILLARINWAAMRQFSFIANRRNAGSFLAQDVSDLHRNLLQNEPQDVFGDH